MFSRCLAVEETATVGVTALVCRNYSVIVRTTRCRPGTVHSPVHVGNTPVNGEGWGKLPRGFIDRFIKRNV